jgi:hypothetical protein
MHFLRGRVPFGKNDYGNEYNTQQMVSSRAAAQIDAKGDCVALSWPRLLSSKRYSNT